MGEEAHDGEDAAEDTIADKALPRPRSFHPASDHAGEPTGDAFDKVGEDLAQTHQMAFGIEEPFEDAAFVKRPNAEIGKEEVFREGDAEEDVEQDEEDGDANPTVGQDLIDFIGISEFLGSGLFFFA